MQRNAEIACKQILNLAAEKNIKIYTSPSSFLTIIFFLKKSGMPIREIRNSVMDLLELFSLKSTNKQDFKAAVINGFNDLEDGVQYQTALRIKGIDYLVTSNIKDFKKAKELAVIRPEDFINLFTDTTR